METNNIQKQLINSEIVRIESKSDISLLNKILKNDKETSIKLPAVLGNDQFIVGIKQNDAFVSFIFFGIYAKGVVDKIEEEEEVVNNFYKKSGISSELRSAEFRRDRSDRHLPNPGEPRKNKTKTKVVETSSDNTQDNLTMFWRDSEHKYVHINYSYTVKEYRSRGHSTALRLYIENFCKENKINYITSTPFENAISKRILDKLDYSTDSVNSQLRYKYINCSD